METLHALTRQIHIFAGFIALVLFWVPAIAHKGGPLHRRAGQLFTSSAYLLLGSAVLGLALNLSEHLLGIKRDTPAQMAFMFLLFYLSITTFVAVHHAVRAVETRRNPEDINTAFHRSLVYILSGASAALIATALAADSLFLMAFAPIGLLGARDLHRYIRAPRARYMGWFYEHIGATIGAGIALHTAFAVFGARRLLGLQPDGFWGVLPWFAPAAIGLVASALLERHYRRHFARAEEHFNAAQSSVEADVKVDAAKNAALVGN
jgi:hypothetical protein